MGACRQVKTHDYPHTKGSRQFCAGTISRVIVLLTRNVQIGLAKNMLLLQNPVLTIQLGKRVHPDKASELIRKNKAAGKLVSVRVIQPFKCHNEHACPWKMLYNEVYFYRKKKFPSQPFSHLFR